MKFDMKFLFSKPMRAKRLFCSLSDLEFKCCSLNNSEYMIPLGVQHQRDYIELGSWNLLPNNI